MPRRSRAGLTSSRVCSIESCDRPHESHGFCGFHARRWRKWGDPHFAPPPHNKGRGPAQMFLRSVLDGTAPQEPNGCILWPFSRNSWGYAGAADSQGRVNPYWVVLEHFAGPRPTDRHTAGHALHEICGNRHCVAPSHLSWQTPWEQNQQQIREGTRRNGRPSPLSPSEKVELAVRHLNGETYDELAAELGVHRQTVYKWVRWVREQGLMEDGGRRAEAC